MAPAPAAKLSARLAPCTDMLTLTASGCTSADSKAAPSSSMLRRPPAIVRARCTPIDTRIKQDILLVIWHMQDEL